MTTSTAAPPEPDPLDEGEAEDAAVRAMAACLDPLRAAAVACRLAWGANSEVYLAVALRRAFAELITSHSLANDAAHIAADAVEQSSDLALITGETSTHG
jgi:hypothetical protein